MALIPSKLIGKWTGEWERFVDTNDTLLDFKLLIGHAQAKIEEQLTGHIQAGLVTPADKSPIV